MSTYGFNQNNKGDGFNPYEILSIILVILIIIVGVILFHIGKIQYENLSIFITIKCSFLGPVGLIILKFLGGFILFMAFGIIHIAIVIKLMEFIRKFLNLN